jgi:hypothetical protein
MGRIFAARVGRGRRDARREGRREGDGCADGDDILEIWFDARDAGARREGGARRETVANDREGEKSWTRARCGTDRRVDARGGRRGRARREDDETTRDGGLTANARVLAR